MEEQELREKIAIKIHTSERMLVRIVYEVSPLNCSWEELPQGMRDLYLQEALSYIALIKEALPELAKEAGYALPEDWKDLDRFLLLAEDWAKANGYVELADDQSLPTNPYKVVYTQDQLSNYAYAYAQQDMLKVVEGKTWRKVEVKDGS